MVDTAYLGNIGKGVDPNDPYATERERLIRFYSEHDPANAAALADAEIGRRKAEDLFAKAQTKLPSSDSSEPTSQLGRRLQSLVNVGGLYKSTPEEQAKIRQGQALDEAKGQVQSSQLETGMQNLTPEQYAIQKAQNLGAYNFLNKVQQGRAGMGGTGTAPVYDDRLPTASPAFADNWNYEDNVVYNPPTSATKVPEILAPLSGDKDSRLMSPVPVPVANKDMIARAQAVAARQANQGKQAAAVPAAAAPAQGGNFFSNLFKSGPDVQSTGQAVSKFTPSDTSQIGPGRGTVHVNWGDSSDAADFFRADKAMRDAQAAGQDVTGMKRGGTAQPHGKDAALHKALEIIHHMLTRGR